MSDESQQQLKPTSKRPRPVLSCLECRRKKLKCDRLLPCQQCLKLDQPSLCTYAPGQEPQLRSNANGPETGLKRAREDESANPSQTSVNYINDLQARVQKLEQALRLQPSSCSTPNHNNDYTPSPAAPVVPNTYPTPGLASGLAPPSPAVEEDFILFEKFKDVQRFRRTLRQSISPGMQNIANELAAVSSAVTKPNKTRPTFIATYNNVPGLLYHMVGILPTTQICNKLIDLYFEHFEHCARNLHKPKFLSQNQLYWKNSLPEAQIEYFVPALLGVLCVASSLNTHPECNLPDLHGKSDGIGAIQLVNNWYEIVLSRDGPSIPAIQVKILIIQAQKSQNANAADLWVASAQLVRQAMTQHLHQEPPATMNNHEAEVRRALWLTILEQDLALAIWCEMPPLCPTYDLKLPANCDDNELSETSAENASEHPIDRWTDGLCAHVLASNFNQRLEAYKHRFAPRTASHYRKTLEYARSLEIVLRDLPPLFRLDHMADNAANTPGRLMAQMDLDIALRRSLIAIYTPYARANSNKEMYREMRVPWVQSHLVVMCFQDLFDPQYPTIDVPTPIGYWDFFFTNYQYDTTQSLEGMFVEAEYLNRIEANQMNIVGDANHITTGESPARIMGWDCAAILKSIEDTLGPMTRRVGKSGGDLKSMLCYNLMFYSLQAPIHADVEAHMIKGLKDLVLNLHKRLVREGYVIDDQARWFSGPHEASEWLADFLSLTA